MNPITPQEYNLRKKNGQLEASQKPALDDHHEEKPHTSAGMSTTTIVKLADAMRDFISAKNYEKSLQDRAGLLANMGLSFEPGDLEIGKTGI
jgi:hypothetical protein